MLGFFNVRDESVIVDFEDDYRDAKAYHRRAEQFLQEGQHPSVVFNVAAVALERYLVALCELHGVAPGNHNYTCLMDAVEELVNVPPELNQAIRSLDRIFGICSLDDYYHGTPESDDTTRVLTMCAQAQNLFEPRKIAEVRAALTQYAI